MSPQFLNFLAASASFARSGFASTPPEILATREATCRACPEWDAAALNATGRCHKCGCSTWAKLRMATEACPLGKWASVSSPSVPFDSLAPARLAPTGPTFGCSTSRLPRRSVVVNPAETLGSRI